MATLDLPALADVRAPCKFRSVKTAVVCYSHNEWTVQAYHRDWMLTPAREPADVLRHEYSLDTQYGPATAVAVILWLENCLELDDAGRDACQADGAWACMVKWEYHWLRPNVSLDRLPLA
eukprot:TRINITY_DN7854_c0_g1_i1.p1 TRINITY_DN7854_c0_g1~~TRINITY_DN7854_c0_g1_i1.p1  ORF type:complete len:120 (+),score=8.91 TRINITY_DN7854_c0_g1_i1:247-606(+)